MPTWVTRETQRGDCHTRHAWQRSQPWGTEIMVRWVGDGAQLCVARVERPGQNTWVQLCDTPREAIRILRGWRRILNGVDRERKAERVRRSLRKHLAATPPAPELPADPDEREAELCRRNPYM